MQFKLSNSRMTSRRQGNRIFTKTSTNEGPSLLFTQVQKKMSSACSLQPATCHLQVSYSAYSSTMKMETIGSSERLVSLD
jgi:hypothetical protein